MSITLRTMLWLGFFGTILLCWVWLFAMSHSMGLTVTGRPQALAARARRLRISARNFLVI